MVSSHPRSRTPDLFCHSTISPKVFRFPLWIQEPFKKERKKKKSEGVKAIGLGLVKRHEKMLGRGDQFAYSLSTCAPKSFYVSMEVSSISISLYHL